MPARKEVDDWLAAYENPMKPVVLRIREVILAADPRIDECLKWKAPTFTFEGNIASFFPRAKKHASLMFHTGAAIPGEHPLLIGGAGTSRYLNLASVAEVDAARQAIEAIVRAWCDWKAASAAAPPVKARATKAARAATPSHPAPRRR